MIQFKDVGLAPPSSLGEEQSYWRLRARALFVTQEDWPFIEIYLAVFQSLKSSLEERSFSRKRMGAG